MTILSSYFPNRLKFVLLQIFVSFVCRSSSYIFAFCSFRSWSVEYCLYSNTAATTPTHFFSTCLLGFSDLRQPQINLSQFCAVCCSIYSMHTYANCRYRDRTPFFFLVLFLVANLYSILFSREFSGSSPKTCIFFRPASQRKNPHATVVVGELKVRIAAGRKIYISPCHRIWL